MPHIHHPRSVLAVNDLERSTRFYMDVLGMKRDFGDGSDGWSFLSRDEFRVMLGHCPDAMPPADLGDHNWYVYLNVTEVDSLHAEFAGKGADILSAPTTKPWGLREFVLRTPDGHRIVFGQPMAQGE